MIDVVDRVAREIFIPFSVGGGIRTVDDMYRALDAGAEKISVNSAAVLNPEIISRGARHFGSQCIVLGMDAKKVGASPAIPSGYEVVINGGRTFTGMDALQWARKAQDLGAGERADQLDLLVGGPQHLRRVHCPSVDSISLIRAATRAGSPSPMGGVGDVGGVESPSNCAGPPPGCGDSGA